LPGDEDAEPDIDRMDLHEFRAARRRKTDKLLANDHRDLKRFFALDAAAYRDAKDQGGLDTKTKELLGLVASTVLRCNECIAYHCDQCVQAGWTKEELLDALNVALVVGGSITIPHIRTVWEVVEQLYDEKAQAERAKEGAPALRKAAAEVKETGRIEEHDSEAKILLGLPPEAKSRKARQARRDADAAMPPFAGAPASSQPAAKPATEPKPPTVKAEGKGPKKSQGV
jgi:AhpD family alkylhydroperoxidase